VASLLRWERSTLSHISSLASTFHPLPGGERTLVSQQICPSCATANSTFASVCRSCSAPLAPRPPSSDAPGGFTVYGSNGQGAASAPAPLAPPASPSHTYEPSPRSEPGEEGGWPAERLSVSSHPVWASNGWTGVPREQPRTPRAPVPHVWGPPPAPGPTRSDGRSSAPVPAPPPLPPAVPPPAPRAPMAFHLDVGAGSALAAAPRVSAPANPPAPRAVDAASPASPPLDPSDAGGRGWGVREQKPSMYPTWAPIPATAGATGGPSAGGAYAGVGVYPGYGYPAQPAASAPRAGRSRAAIRALVLLVFVALVGAGAFLYLSSESAQGLGSGTHTLSTPATLRGLPQTTTSAMTALSSQVKSQTAAEPGITGSVFTVYTSATPGGPGYILGIASDDQAVTSSDLSQFVAGFNSSTGVTFNLTTASVSSDNGVSFHCAPVTLSGAADTLCVWGDGNVIGMVIGSSGAGSAATLVAAEKARTTAEH
jgi:ribosomal protein L40E